VAEQGEGAGAVAPIRDPTVAIVATGGTIQNTRSGRVAVDEVLADIERDFAPGLAGIAALRVTDLFRDGAETFAPTHWARIADAVRREAGDEGVDGVVVTHGTFTVEETAFFTHLTAGTAKPVVFVCAQRKHGSLGGDGDRNLVDAIRVAADPGAAGRGAVVVIAEEIHAAREVTKTSQRPGGFASGGLGLLGTIETDRISWYRAPTRRHTLRSEFAALDLERPLPRVDVVAAYPGADGTAVRAFTAAGAAGIVVHGFSFLGAPFPGQEPDLLRAIDAGIPVVLASRGGDGRIPGGAPLDARYVTADRLTAQKARVLLMIALAAEVPHEELQRVFDEY
jgi:L-asparaginase